MQTTEYIEFARAEARRLGRWIDEQVEPVAVAAHPSELAGWRRELGLIHALIDSPDRVRVALVGTTGAGKSTLLNAILGQEILPVGVMSPCTAFVTSVSHWDRRGYELTVHFISRAEWEADVQNLAAALAPGEADADGGENIRIINAAQKRVQTVCGLESPDLVDPAFLTELQLPPNAAAIIDDGTPRTKGFASGRDMLVELKTFIHEKSALWPLVKRVHIRGPFNNLGPGVELVDLPGLNDPNEARIEVTREYLRTSPFVWVVFNMVRGITEDIETVLRREKLLRSLVLSGNYNALSLVGTRADDIDNNVADQFELPEDCSTVELINAYRRQTEKEARARLIGILRDIAGSDRDSDTFNRMVEFAQTIRIHTTSSNAYNKIMKIGALRKDFGLDDIHDTGIPQIHAHLAEISQTAGAAFNAKTAMVRLRQLRDEIAFFFRAQAQPASKELADIRQRLQDERAALSAEITRIRDTADERLRVYRQKFMEQLQPLLLASIQGVQRVTEDWNNIHWATLRGIVRNDGIFKSPSKGRTYNFNENVADPLLSQLPMTWQRYFTDDLGSVTHDYALLLTEKANNFCGRVQLLVQLLFHKKDEGVEEQLRWFREKIEFHATSAQNRIGGAVRERRSELAAKMPLVARGYMLPAYESARAESGSGMKQRMLGHLRPRALQTAQPIFETIQQDLLEGLSDLELQISGLFRELAQQAEEQARLIAHNANVDVDEATLDPVVGGLLRSVPELGSYT